MGKEYLEWETVQTEGARNIIRTDVSGKIRYISSGDPGSKCYVLKSDAIQRAKKLNLAGVSKWAHKRRKRS